MASLSLVMVFSVLLGLLLCTFTRSEPYQRRVCPRIRNYLQRWKCQGVENKCSSDEECRRGQRCCPTENECFLSCQTTVKPVSCRIPTDLLLLLDSSGSIGRRNWRKVKEFAKHVTDIYDISENGTHIAIVMYSTRPEIMIKFNKYKGAELNAVNVKRDIDRFRLQRGLTFIDKALEVADNQIFTEEAGMRKDAQKVCFVLTDGVQTKNRGPYTPLFLASQPLKDKGVNIYSIGVGRNIQHAELMQIASSPNDIFRIQNFDELSKKVKDITKAQCEAPVTTPVPTTTKAPVTTPVPSTKDPQPDRKLQLSTAKPKKMLKKRMRLSKRPPPPPPRP